MSTLATSRFVAPRLEDPAAQRGPEELGWIEVYKGLWTIILAYAMTVANVGLVVGLLFWITQGFKKGQIRTSGDDFTVIIIMAAILFLSSLASGYLILRGKWRCLVGAPERCGAKWWMFASMICVVAGPGLNMISGFIDDPQVPRAAREDNQGVIRINSPGQYAKAAAARNPAGYAKLAGAIAATLGPIFLILFLRAVNLCVENPFGARMAELQVVFTILMGVAGIYLLFNIAKIKSMTTLLMWLGGAALFDGVWYLILIVSTITSIGAYMEASSRSPLAN